MEPRNRTKRAKKRPKGGRAEIERAYCDFDENVVRGKLESLGAHHVGKFLFRHARFAPPVHDPNIKMLRVRDEGARVTMTQKHQRRGDTYPIEYEIVVDSFNGSVAFLCALGARELYRAEKLRDIYTVVAPSGSIAEIVFDEYPALPSYIEIEAASEGDLYSVAGLLGLNPDEVQGPMVQKMYARYYGVDRKVAGGLLFEEINYSMGPLVKNNLDLFDALLRQQLADIEDMRSRK